MFPQITPLGDSALTLTFGTDIDEQVNNEVFLLFKYLKQQEANFIKDVIPAYASIAIVYDILKVKSVYDGLAFDAMKAFVEKAMAVLKDIEQITKRQLHIPVCYDVSLGLDLMNMCKEKGMSVDEIVELHTSKTYRVYMVGFLPGFAYMGTVDERIATPRKIAPRQKVLAGSVGIADAQTGIYPFDSPGGWNIVGLTPEPLFFPKLNEPCLFEPGDEVTFIPITLKDFNLLKQDR